MEKGTKCNIKTSKIKLILPHPREEVCIIFHIYTVDLQYPGGHGAPSQSRLACLNTEILKHPYCVDFSTKLTPIPHNLLQFDSSIRPKIAPIPLTFWTLLITYTHLMEFG